LTANESKASHHNQHYNDDTDLSMKFLTTIRLSNDQI